MAGAAPTIPLHVPERQWFRAPPVDASSAWAQVMVPKAQAKRVDTAADLIVMPFRLVRFQRRIV